MKAWLSRTFGLQAPTWRLIALLIVVVLIFATALTLIVGHRYRPDANQLCECHGGVRMIAGAAGLFSGPNHAVCRDGFAGRIYE